LDWESWSFFEAQAIFYAKNTTLSFPWSWLAILKFKEVGTTTRTNLGDGKMLPIKFPSSLLETSIWIQNGPVTSCK